MVLNPADADFYELVSDSANTADTRLEAGRKLDLPLNIRSSHRCPYSTLMRWGDHTSRLLGRVTVCFESYRANGC